MLCSETARTSAFWTLANRNRKNNRDPSSPLASSILLEASRTRLRKGPCGSPKKRLGSTNSLRSSVNLSLVKDPLSLVPRRIPVFSSHKTSNIPLSTKATTLRAGTKMAGSLRITMGPILYSERRNGTIIMPTVVILSAVSNGTIIIIEDIKTSSGFFGIAPIAPVVLWNSPGSFMFFWKKIRKKF